MRTILTLSTFLIFSIFLHAQVNLEVDGKVKIGDMEKVNSADSVVVRLSDGTLGLREITSIILDSSVTNEIQFLSVLNETITLSKGGNSIKITELGCETGFWAISRGRLCMDSTLQAVATMHDAISTCKAISPGSRVCTFSDFVQACSNSFTPAGGISTGWLGDKANDDDYFHTWNSSTCSSNFDGHPMHATSTTLVYRCCY